jgi:Zn-finger nucleic acid-binding protein
MPGMNAESLNCPNCGAASATDLPRCQFCGSRLATIACSSCFALMFAGSKHCQRCGAPAAVPQVVALEKVKCPRCETTMSQVTIGTTAVLECERCFGLWLDVASFERICTDREQQSAVLGFAAQAPVKPVNDTSRVKYVPCPVCSQLMNRMNFARCSGVIVDICKQHGTWFDRDELSRIVEFISGGGLEASRIREKEELKEERRRLSEAHGAADSRVSGFFIEQSDEHRLSGIASARGLLKFLLDG